MRLARNSGNLPWYLPPSGSSVRRNDDIHQVKRNVDPLRPPAGCAGYTSGFPYFSWRSRSVAAFWLSGFSRKCACKRWQPLARWRSVRARYPDFGSPYRATTSVGLPIGGGLRDELLHGPSRQHDVSGCLTGHRQFGKMPVPPYPGGTGITFPDRPGDRKFRSGP
jgi:hypothetical protein